MPLFVCPPERSAALETVKQQVGIQHHYLDGWIYLFLSNKKFDIAETVAKLQRRDNMEKTVFANYTITPRIRTSMRAGIVQYIGRDKEGRHVLYFNTARDAPTSDRRPENQANMDMFLSWSVRCDVLNPSSQVTWLINQKDASMMRHVDLIFQKDMALRISKFFPGVIAKMYICNMSTALTFVMRPLLRQLPSAISDTIFMFSSGDIGKGKLLDFIDASVLPIAMGGNNDCDNQDNYNFFAETVEGYFNKCVEALNNGISIKEMEMMEAYPVDRHGQPLPEPEPTPATPSPPPTSGYAEEEMPLPSRSVRFGASSSGVESITVRDEGGNRVIMSSSVARRSTDKQPSDLYSVDELEDSTIAPATRMTFFTQGASTMDLTACNTSFAYRCQSGKGLPVPHVDLVDRCTVQCLASLTPDEESEVVRDWARFRAFSVEAAPLIHSLINEIREESIEGERHDILIDNAELMYRVASYTFLLFPATSKPLRFPILRWLSQGSSKCKAPMLSVRDVVEFDCTSVNNFLLSVQAATLEFVDECARMSELDRAKERILRRLALTWPEAAETKDVVIKQLNERVGTIWTQLVLHFQKYTEAKVGMAIAEFIGYHGLLAAGGCIDEDSKWYRDLFTQIIQFREEHRKKWLFYVFPPLFRNNVMNEEPPTMREILEEDGKAPTLKNVAALIVQADNSMKATKEHLMTSPSAARIMNLSLLVERFLEDTGSKIYIPYDSQGTGLSPEDLGAREQRVASETLEGAELLLKDFLFNLSAIILLEDLLDDVESRTDCVARLVELEEDISEDISHRRNTKRLAAGLAKVAFHMQVSLESQLLCVQNRQRPGNDSPDGFALGLELLFLLSVLEPPSPLDNASFVASPVSAFACGSLPLRTTNQKKKKEDDEDEDEEEDETSPETDLDTLIKLFKELDSCSRTLLERPRRRARF